MSEGRVLVVDVGTSSVRAGIVGADATVREVEQIPVLPSSPEAGMVEFDGAALRDAVIEVARRSLSSAGSVDGVGIANQRATTLVWDARSGQPVGPAIGWQDLRTVISCLLLQAEGLRLAPNVSATKVQWLLDTFRPDRGEAEHLRFGTVDSWVAWTLSGGRLHVTDATNAAVTGLLDADATSWDQRTLGILGIPEAMMPTIVDSSGPVGEATELPGEPVICGIAGDQQASLIGQGCVAPGQAKITFGTGGMLDMVTGPDAPASAQRSPGGTFPIVARQIAGQRSWGLEAIMLSAGSCLEWLRDDLGIISSPAESSELARSCSDAGGLVFVPALLGLGTPRWDFGARGLLLGITRGTGRPEIARAVLDGVAHRGADLVEAAEADSGRSLERLRVDGGMSANPTFVQMLADATGRPVEVSPVLEATTLGAGFLAGLSAGLWSSEAEVAETWSPSAVVDPAIGDGERSAARARFAEASARAEQTIPELSGVEF